MKMQLSFHQGSIRNLTEASDIGLRHYHTAKLVDIGTWIFKISVIDLMDAAYNA